MSMNVPSLGKDLSKHASLFGIRIWILVVALIVFFAVLVLIIVVLCVICFQRRNSKSFKPPLRLSNPITCNNYRNAYSSSSLDMRLLSRREIEMNIAKPDHHHDLRSSSNQGSRIMTRECSSEADLELGAGHSSDVLNAWRGNEFSLNEIEIVTNGFVDENLIGNGDHGVVHRGFLSDSTPVAVKRLLSKSCQVKDFQAQVEAIGHVRHKNLVRSLGYCMEGGYRMLINEYVDNGNLHQWLHGCPEHVSPLTWERRMNIIQGIAKGLAYLHEDVEPKIVHQDLKSSNILLDHQWNPKISDFGIAWLFGPEWNLIIASSMATSGYLAQEYASAGDLDESADVYSFGILVMEIICGRTPVEQHQPQAYLIDWLKSMVANRKVMYVVDPKLPEMPSSKELKRMLLLALRCVDLDKKHRPTMGDVIHMLEPRDLLLDEYESRREESSRQNFRQEYHDVAELSRDNFNMHEKESGNNVYEKMMPKK